MARTDSGKGWTGSFVAGIMRITIMQAQTIRRYSREPIMTGLRRIVPDWTGSTKSFDADTRIDEYLKGMSLWDDLDLGDLMLGAERYFGFRCPEPEWHALFGCALKTKEEWEATVGPRLTFGHLADFIAERAQAVPLESLSILGKACDVAGAFRATETVARQVRRRTKAFGPSTPIRRILVAGKLNVFWNRLRWMTEDGIPPLRTTVLTRFDQGCCIVAFLGCLVFPFWTIVELLAGEWHKVMHLLVAVSTLVVGAFGIHRLVARLDDRLPDGVRTFGDLARMVAESPAFGRRDGAPAVAAESGPGRQPAVR